MHTTFSRKLSIALGATLIAGSALAQVKIAYIDPLSGPFANVGELMLAHVQYAVDDINADRKSVV